MTGSDQGRVIAAVKSIFSHSLGSARYHRFQIAIHPDLAVMDKVSDENIEQLRAAGAREVREQNTHISEVVSLLTLGR